MGKLTGKSFYKEMLALALPIALQNLMASCANLVDTAMVTRLGNIQIAAVGVAGRWSFFIHIVLFGIASGSSVLLSQYWGAKDVDGIKKTFSTGMLLGLCAAAVYTVLCLTIPDKMIGVFTNESEVISEGAKYLRIFGIATIPNCFGFISSVARRATEDVKTPLVIAGITVLTNVTFNYILIYGHLGFPAMGVSGAAAATTIAMFVYLTLYIILGRRQKHFTGVSLAQIFRPDKEFFGRYIKIAAPVLFNETVWAIAMNIYNYVFSMQGSENYAAYTVFNSIQELSFIFFVGICNACAIMVGKIIGAGRVSEAHGLAKRYLIMTPLLGVFVGLTLILIRNPVLDLMRVETEYARNIASNLLLFYGVWLGIRNIPYTAVVGIFRAGGDTKSGFYLDVGTMYFWSLPIIIILAYVVHVPFIWLIMAMYLCEDSVKAVICIRYFNSRRWIRQLTRTGENPELTPADGEE